MTTATAWTVAWALGALLGVSGCVNPNQGPGPVHACTPGDRAYCSGNGVCDDAGLRCLCDDEALSPSSRCAASADATGGDTGGLIDDPVCTPGDVNYCNYNGRCAVDGSACVCDDPDHYVPTDNCRNYYVSTRRFGEPCDYGSRAQCNDKGTCGEDGWCVCDDDLHHSPVDDCNSYFDNPPDVPPPWDP
ncbi:MAG: hypothetical protein KC635_26925 [Myxococcales bacterium]|nr:hypothetical protein [Myxococcales bacterium]